MPRLLRDNFKIIQFAHGKVSPSYSSAYGVRCQEIFKGKDRKIISVGGLVLNDYLSEEVEQYRSMVLSAISYLKGNRYFEIGISNSKFLRGKYKKRIRSILNDFDVLVFEGPWIFPLLEDIIESDKIVVYDSHNVEGRLRSGNRYEKESREIERRLVERADLIFAMSIEDAKGFQTDYSADPEKVQLLPLLSDLKPYQWSGQDTYNVTFVGSLYDPNVRAVQQIGKWAKDLTEFKFHIIGSVSNVRPRVDAGNMIYHGVVDEETKRKLFNESLIAINPVGYGGGRNLKILDYFSQGIPVITTPIGFRGLDPDTWNGLVYIKELDEFPGVIKELKKNSSDLPSLSRRIYDTYQDLFKEEGKEDAYDIILKRFITP